MSKLIYLANLVFQVNLFHCMLKPWQPRTANISAAVIRRGPRHPGGGTGAQSAPAALRTPRPRIVPSPGWGMRIADLKKKLMIGRVFLASQTPDKKPSSAGGRVNDRSKSRFLVQPLLR